MDNSVGEIASQGVVALNLTEQLDNRGGKIVGDSGLGITAPHVLNQDRGTRQPRWAAPECYGVVQRRGGLLSSQKGIDVSWPVRSITRPAAWTAGAS